MVVSTDGIDATDDVDDSHGADDSWLCVDHTSNHRRTISTNANLKAIKSSMVYRGVNCFHIAKEGEQPIASDMDGAR